MSTESGLKLCEQCGKEPAAVFLYEKNNGSGNRRSLCLNCAKQQNIPQVQEYLRQNKAPAAGKQMCMQCGKQPALIWISRTSGGRMRREGLCVFCAREQNIPQIEELLAGMNRSDAELRVICEEYMQQTDQPKGLLQRLRRLFKR